MALLGYARVSTKGQDLTIQKDRLLEVGVREDRIFMDKASGKTTDGRDGLDKLLARAEQGDTIKITKLDRLGRNTRDMLEIIEDLNERGVVMDFIDNGISTGGETGMLVITILAAVAESERARIMARTNEGRQAAKDAGIKFGRKRTVDREAVIADLDNWWGDGMSKAVIAEKHGISRSFVYKIEDEAWDTHWFEGDTADDAERHTIVMTRCPEHVKAKWSKSEQADWKAKYGHLVGAPRESFITPISPEEQARRERKFVEGLAAIEAKYGPQAAPEFELERQTELEPA